MTQNNGTAKVRHDGDNCTTQDGLFRPPLSRTHRGNYLASKERKSMFPKRWQLFLCVLLKYGGMCSVAEANIQSSVYKQSSVYTFIAARCFAKTQPWKIKKVWRKKRKMLLKVQSKKTRSLPCLNVLWGF